MTISKISADDAIYRRLIEAITDYAIYALDADGVVTSWNAGAARFKGYVASEIVGQHFSRFYTEEDRLTGLPARALGIAASTGRFESEGWRLRKDGSRLWAHVIIDPIWGDDGELLGLAKVTRDVTERKDAQKVLEETREVLFQAQKMEAVGQLTGGIAHDFNNLLAGISGSLEMIASRLGQGRIDAVPRYLNAAQEATRRAAALTQRLLAFSRRQTLDPRPVDVNRLIGTMEDLLRRTTGAGVTVKITGAPDLWPILVDANQLENVLLNLWINARDAMPDGGALSLETANLKLDEAAARLHDLSPGDYVSITVSDTGHGMSETVIARAFEPFYTTKPMGQGTGLGLSMAFGFVRQSLGQLHIRSRPGEGAAVSIYLPRHLGVVEPERADETPSPGVQGVAGETVMVIDDDETVRMLMVEVLREAGYSALEAADGPEGLRVMQSTGRIDLLVTDVGLPGGMNGRQVADVARLSQPGLKVLFITGYAEKAVMGDARLGPGMALLTKPFTMDALGRKIAEMIALSAPAGQND